MADRLAGREQALKFHGTWKGRVRTRAVIITDSDHVILSAVQPETVANRLNDDDEEEELEEDE